MDDARIARTRDICHRPGKHLFGRRDRLQRRTSLPKRARDHSCNVKPLEAADFSVRKATVNSILRQYCYIYVLYQNNPARVVRIEPESGRKSATLSLVWTLLRHKRDPPMAPRILVVDSNHQSSVATEQLLTAAGYESASVTTFEEATQSLTLNCPDLLVTDVRLGAFNGLHLALRARVDHPNLPILVLGDTCDASLAADAARLGARFVAKTTDPGAFLGLVRDLLPGQPSPDGSLAPSEEAPVIDLPQENPPFGRL